ncbi:MAG: hypothetical protein WBN35_10410, partial [Acidimicrobiia bacterium]
SCSPDTNRLGGRAGYGEAPCSRPDRREQRSWRVWVERPLRVNSAPLGADDGETGIPTRHADLRG